MVKIKEKTVSCQLNVFSWLFSCILNSKIYYMRKKKKKKEKSSKTQHTLEHTTEILKVEALFQ